MLQAILMALSLCRAQSNANTGIPHFIALYRYCFLFFFNTESLWPPFVKQVCWCHLPTTFAYSGSPSNILVILTIFQPFSLLLWCSVIFDATIVIWRYRELCSCDGKVNPQMSVF